MPILLPSGGFVCLFVDWLDNRTQLQQQQQTDGRWMAVRALPACQPVWY